MSKPRKAYGVSAIDLTSERIGYFSPTLTINVQYITSKIVVLDYLASLVLSAPVITTSSET